MNPPSKSNLFDIVVCELCHPLLQGYIEHTSSSDISEHYMTLESIEPSEIFINIDDIPLDDIDNLFVCLKIRRRMFRKFTQHPSFQEHPSIRNYSKISSEITFSPQIAHCIALPGEEHVAILKTHWLRLIQRTWKKIFQQRLNVTKVRKNPRNVRYREIHGKWSQCCRMPTLQGMLSPLLRR